MNVSETVRCLFVNIVSEDYRAREIDDELGFRFSVFSYATVISNNGELLETKQKDWTEFHCHVILIQEKTLHLPTQFSK